MTESLRPSPDEQPEELERLRRRVTELETFPASGIISHIHGHVLTIDGGFLLLYPQEYGHYLYEVLLDAAVPFDGGPVGVDALPTGGIW